MKKTIVSVILIILLLLLSGCGTEQNNRVTNAIFRYFDGTGEMVMVDHYRFCSGGAAVRVWTAEGREIVIGVNNVMIITEDENEQFNHDYEP